jgi:hypothetical protein
MQCVTVCLEVVDEKPTLPSGNAGAQIWREVCSGWRIAKCSLSVDAEAAPEVVDVRTQPSFSILTMNIARQIIAHLVHVELQLAVQHKHST